MQSLLTWPLNKLVVLFFFEWTSIKQLPMFWLTRTCGYFKKRFDLPITRALTRAIFVRRIRLRFYLPSRILIFIFYWSGGWVDESVSRVLKNRRNNNFDGEKSGGILIKNKLIIIFFFEFQSRKSVVRFVPSRIRQLYRKKKRKNRAATLLRDKVASLLLFFTTVITQVDAESACCNTVSVTVWTRRVRSAIWFRYSFPIKFFFFLGIFGKRKKK